jgi:lipopolysaccharide/colanic/teichoic acid biosynthesis glycosyltransferase
MVRRQYDTLKRALDLIAALAALTLMWPLFALLAVYVRWRSPGPAFFSQERIGLDGRPFRLWKFRTMHVRTASSLESDVTTRDDPRIYAGGRWLRKLKFDELPQLWNVANGTMSMVGPRPTVASDYARMSPWQRQRCLVRPGITGLAQIRGNSALSWPQRIEWDLHYMQRRTFSLDLAILAETVWQVVTLRADRPPAKADEWDVAA